MIYLASPYSDKSTFVMERRYTQALAVVAEMSKAGLVVYSPIVHFHEVARRFSLPADFQFWKQVNFGMLDRALELWILKQPGWDNSIGITAEDSYARSLGIPIKRVELDEWLK